MDFRIFLASDKAWSYFPCALTVMLFTMHTVKKLSQHYTPYT